MPMQVGKRIMKKFKHIIELRELKLWYLVHEYIENTVE